MADPEQQKILDQIAGRPSLEDLKIKLALAQRLRQAPASDPISSAGNAHVANWGGLVSDMANRRSAQNDINGLEGQISEMQRSSLRQNVDSLEPVPPAQIDSFEDQPASPITARLSPGVQADRMGQRAQLESLGEADPMAVQKLLQQKLSFDYAGGRDKLSATGGARGMNNTYALWMADRRASHPEESMQASQEAWRLVSDSLSVSDVGGNQVLHGTRSGVGPTLVTAAEDAANAALRKREEAAGTVTGTEEQKRLYEAGPARAAADSVKRGMSRVIAKAGDLQKDPSLWRAMGLGAYLPSMWGGTSEKIDTAVESLRAELGLSQLQDLRAKGSTLGQVTEAEHKLLQDSLVSLSQSVSPPEYRARMQQVIEYAKNLQAAVDRQYEAQYGAGAYRDTRLAPQSQPGLPLSSGRNAPPASAPRTVRFEDL